MKLTLALVLMMISGLSFGQDKPGDYTFTADKGKYIKMGKGRYFVVPVTFTNNTNAELSYYSLSCAWWDFYQTDSKELLWTPEYPCTVNTPVLLKLAPHKSVKKDLEFKIANSHVSEIKCRVGFSLIIDKHTKTDVLTGMKKKPNIIWSNEIAGHI